MASVFKLTSEKVKGQLAVVLTDASTYDTHAPATYGVAVIYSKDNFVADAAIDYSSPGDLYNVGPWNISDLSNQADYTFRAYWVEKFRAYVAQPLQEGSIVWHENQYYVKVSAGSTNSDAVNPPDQNDADFHLLDVGETIAFSTLSQFDVINASALDLANIFEGLAGSGGVVGGGTATTTSTLEEPNFVKTKLACYSYQFTKTSTGTWSIYVYTFSDYIRDGDPILEDTITTGNTYTVSLPEGDNVYVVKILFNDTVNNVSYLQYIPIYEYCELESCMTKAIRDILCNETVCDPSLDCDNSGIMSLEGTKRIDLLKIVSLYFEMFTNIHAEQMKYLDKFMMTDDRSSRLQRASDAIARINEVLTHCDLCGSGAVGQSGCESCSNG